MRLRYLSCLISVFSLLTEIAIPARTAVAQDRSGLRRVSSQPFLVPPESHAISLEGCDFETGKMPTGWGHGHAEVVIANDAPQGRAYFSMKAKKGADIRSPVFPAQAGNYYFISYWLKNTDEPWAYIYFTSDEREPSFTNTYPGVGFSTSDQWRQVGFYFWVPAQCKTIQFHLAAREDGAEGQFIALDDIRLRTATEAELTSAYEAERSHLPPYDVSSRPGDGKHLALSVAKWEGRAGIPGKPFVIWALGSSYTDWQGDGAELIHAIRQRFPDAPPIIYRKHGGPGTPWEFVHAWIKLFVAAEQPDLIFTYTSGSLEGLDALLAETRRHSTAEIIVPSLHFAPTSTITTKDIETGRGIEWAKVRDLCEKHGAEYVENRREMADYLARTGLTADDLLSDHNHQNLHGRTRVWDNVSRHLTRSDQSTYTTESRERRIAVVPPTISATENVSMSGDWTTSNGMLRSGGREARLKVSFTGNRIDLIGRKTAGGGTVRVLVDGVPGDQAPAFLTNSIMANRKHLWRAPHAVKLGPNLVPQKWTITVTSDVGDFRVEGSGWSRWARAISHNRSSLNVARSVSIRNSGVRAGSRRRTSPSNTESPQAMHFISTSLRSASGTQSFQAAEPTKLIEPLVRNLPNGQHTVELITNGDGEVMIEGLYVYQPPGNKVD